jgi:hypothetical protein
MAEGVMPRPRYCATVAIILSTFLTASSGQTAPQTPDEAISQFEKTTRSFKVQDSTTEIDVQNTVTQPNRGAVTKWSHFWHMLQTDGSRMRFEERQFHLSSQSAIRDIKNAHETLVLWTGENWFEYYRIPPEPKHRYIVQKPDGRDRSEWVNNEFEACLQGVLSGDDKPLSEILRGASQINGQYSRDDTSGVLLYRVNATTPQGKYTIWFDPTHQFNIARAEVVKAGNDLYYGKPLSAEKPPGNVVKSKLTEYGFTVRDVVFQRVDGIFFPTQARFSCRMTRSDGESFQQEGSYTCTHVDLAPDFAKQAYFRPVFPDGTRVFVLPDDGVVWVWQDGKVVKRSGSTQPATLPTSQP